MVCVSALIEALDAEDDEAEDCCECAPDEAIA
jgi:hypothetical protein